MTDQTPEPPFRLNLSMRDDTGQEVTLLNPYLGMSPYVLIEFSADEEAVQVSVSSGGGIPADITELIEGLRGVADMIEEGRKQSEEAQE
jgi:hypothetical protein